MQVTSIETLPLDYRRDPPPFSAGGASRGRAALLVLVRTDAGVTGIGEAGLGGAPLRVMDALIRDELAPCVVGQDPFYVERCWRLMWQRSRQHGRTGLAMFGISGIDIALWDVVGKATGTPLFKLWGAYRDRVPAYFGGGFYRRGKGLAGLREEAGQAVERGFRGLKMKIGRNPEVPASPLEFQAGGEELTNALDRDLERVAAVREVLGRSRELMLDVNCNWTPAFAIRAGRALERFRPCWIEEPVAADDHEGSAEVARALDMLEWDQNPNPLRSDLAREPLVLEGDGTVRLPERPGLGIELEPAVVDRHRVEL